MWDWNLPANRVKAWDFLPHFLLRSYRSSYQHSVHCSQLKKRAGNFWVIYIGPRVPHKWDYWKFNVRSRSILINVSTMCAETTLDTIYRNDILPDQWRTLCGYNWIFYMSQWCQSTLNWSWSCSNYIWRTYPTVAHVYDYKCPIVKDFWYIWHRATRLLSNMNKPWPGFLQQICNYFSC